MSAERLYLSDCQLPMNCQAATREAFQRSQRCCFAMRLSSSACFASSSAAETKWSRSAILGANCSRGNSVETRLRPCHQSFQKEQQPVRLHATFTTTKTSSTLNHKQNAAILDSPSCRSFIRSNGNNEDVNDDANSYTYPMTRATATQMKGEIREAVTLTSKA